MSAPYYDPLEFVELLRKCRLSRDFNKASDSLKLLDEVGREHLLQFLFTQSLMAREWWLTEECLKHGIPIDPSEREVNGPLWVAMNFCGDAPDVVAWLLDRGAQIERRFLSTADETPLMYASTLGLSRVVELLLQRGADPNATTRIDDDDTALTLAAKTGHKRVVELLLAHGAQVGHQNWSGRDATTLAREAGHDDICELLTEKKGQWKSRSQGKTKVPGANEAAGTQ